MQGDYSGRYRSYYQTIKMQHCPGGICSALVAHPRSPVAIAACQMARELFEITQCTVNPVSKQ
jgi:hypothetical protein